MFLTKEVVWCNISSMATALHLVKLTDYTARRCAPSIPTLPHYVQSGQTLNGVQRSSPCSRSEALALKPWQPKQTSPIQTHLTCSVILYSVYRCAPGANAPTACAEN